MSDALVQAAGQVGGSLAGVVLGALLAQRWALRQFASERWWERKAGAYSDVVKALYELSEAPAQLLGSRGGPRG